MLKKNHLQITSFHNHVGICLWYDCSPSSGHGKCLKKYNIPQLLQGCQLFHPMVVHLMGVVFNIL